jgi:hypothetical protein
MIIKPTPFTRVHLLFLDIYWLSTNKKCIHTTEASRLASLSISDNLTEMIDRDLDAPFVAQLAAT